LGFSASGGPTCLPAFLVLAAKPNKMAEDRSIPAKNKEVVVTEKNVLADLQFFSEVAPDTLEMIAQLGELFELEPEEVLFHSNEPAEHFYALLKGEIDLSIVFTDRVLKTDIEYEESIQASLVEEEKWIIVDTVYPGQVFGWASLVGPGRRTVTAQCTADSSVIAIPAVEFKKMLEADHSLGYRVMTKLSNIISNRLKNRSDKLIEAWVEAFDTDKI
jgi:CRP/FNR family transcriptional regulator, cyclic AMP receptor protein